MKIFAIKKRSVFFVLCAFVLVLSGFVYLLAPSQTFQPLSTKTIVIDAGHGGKDGGAVGKYTGIEEKELNLVYAKTLKRICEEFDFRVVMTRKDNNGLYSPLAKNKKKSEMQKREDIIKKSNPDLLVSIHMNSFPQESCRGAQVFYRQDNEGGRYLAEKIQTSLHEKIEFAKATAKTGDYYVLNCTNCAGVLIECGFLSNREEEQILQDKNYINKFCYQVFCGILQFFKMV